MQSKITSKWEVCRGGGAIKLIKQLHYFNLRIEINLVVKHLIQNIVLYV